MCLASLQPSFGLQVGLAITNARSRSKSTSTYAREL